jgi:hypothetical protein
MTQYLLTGALALMFGGMVAFQLLFAPLLFTRLEMGIARKFIRNFFPFYYLYFGVLSVIACLLSFINQATFATWLLGVCSLGFLISRQILMPKANKASDSGNKKQFDTYHRFTVIINTIQLILIAYVTTVNGYNPT